LERGGTGNGWVGAIPSGAPQVPNRRVPMSGKFDESKGRVKEAAGDLTDDDDLKREGKADRAAGKAKDTVESMKDKAEDMIDSAKHKMS
jgi:uncharacterized protein YjbJ (UPF0337 family)